MVEVWLPFGETRMPILLPDPVDIGEIRARGMGMEAPSLDMKPLEELQGEGGLRVVFDPEATPKQREIIGESLSSAKIKWEEWRRGGDDRVPPGKECSLELGEISLALEEDPSSGDILLAGVMRPSALFGFSGCLTSLFTLLPGSSLLQVLEACLDPSLGYGGESWVERGLLEAFERWRPRSLSLIPHPVGGVAKVLLGEGGGVWRESVRMYRELWSSTGELKGLILASCGGTPWDSYLIGSLNGLYNIALKAPRESPVIYVMEGGEGLEIEPTLLWMSLKKRTYRDAYTASVVKLKRVLEARETRPMMLSSIPHIFTEGLRIRRIGDIDKAISSLTSRERREATLIPMAWGTLLP